MNSMKGDFFNEYLENKVRYVIESYQLIKADERIAVALSGGKDSVLTLYLLKRLVDVLNFELIAIFIDEGISGYRDEGLKIARQHARELGVELVEKSFIEEFEFKIEDISTFYKSSCIPCGVFRRYLLNKTAYEMGIDKLATGHNLDDEIQSFLMSFVRADTRKFSKFGPILDKIHPKLIPRIKPLWNVPEREVGIWAVLNNVNVHFAECPYSKTSLRSKIRDFLNQMEAKRPGTKINILKSFNCTFKSLKTSNNLIECEKCGEPSSSLICKVCEMISDIYQVI
jgi:uncharacterized protein (TIGR00269 family)